MAKRGITAVAESGVHLITLPPCASVSSGVKERGQKSYWQSVWPFQKCSSEGTLKAPSSSSYSTPSEAPASSWYSHGPSVPSALTVCALIRHINHILQFSTFHWHIRHICTPSLAASRASGPPFAPSTTQDSLSVCNCVQFLHWHHCPLLGLYSLELSQQDLDFSSVEKTGRWPWTLTYCLTASG